MTTHPTIEAERPPDAADIDALLAEAFGGPIEAALVVTLRETAPEYVAFVARMDGAVVGHVVFTPVEVRDRPRGEAVFSATALGPVAVRKAWQRQGIGAALVRAGLEAVRAAGERVVFVLGDPAYYGRFGFQPAAPRGLHYRSHDLDPYFMVAELVPGALAGRSGWVEYLPPFELADGR